MATPDYASLLPEINQAQSWGGGTDEYGNPTFTPSQALKDTGAFGMPVQDSQGNSTYALSPSSGAINYDQLPKTSQGTSIAGWVPYDSKAEDNYYVNPDQHYKDPVWGDITPGYNIAKHDDLLDKIGGYVPAAIGAIGGLAMANPAMLFGDAFAGMGMAADLGTLGSSLFKGAEGLMQGQKFNPVGTALNVAGSFLPSSVSQVMPYVNTGMQLAKGNYVGAMMPYMSKIPSLFNGGQ